MPAWVTHSNRRCSRYSSPFIASGSSCTSAWHCNVPLDTAKELCENGLKTLVLERGRMVKHLEDYPTMHQDPWDMPHGGATPDKILKDYDKQKRWGFDETKRHFYN